jgi:hypothetical protein
MLDMEEGFAQRCLPGVAENAGHSRWKIDRVRPPLG